MKRAIKLISVLLVLAMLTFAFAACKDDTDSGQSESSSTSSSSSKKETKINHKVTIKDGLTGAVLETGKVPDGRSAAGFVSHYDDLHYGYKLDKEHESEVYGAPIIEDTEIILQFEPLEIYTIYLQNSSGEMFEFGRQYEFKRALTPEEMGTVAEPGLNSLDEPYFGNGKTLLGAEGEDSRNDWKTEYMSGCIKVYEGYIINSEEIPAAPAVFNGDFLNWVIIEGADADDHTGGTVVEYEFFTGIGVVSDLVVRAKYTESGTGARADNNLAALASTPEVIFANLVDNIEARGVSGDADAYYDTEYKNGHEKLKYGDEKAYIGKNTDTTFLYANGMGSFYYCVDKNLQSNDPVINRFNGTTATAQVQVDQNTYIAFDGRYMYVLIIIRDDTPIYASETDAEVLKAKAEAGDTYNWYSLCDNVEIRFCFNINNKYTDLPLRIPPNYDEVNGVYSGGNLDYRSTAENSLRTLSIDRTGNICKIANDEYDIKQTDYVEIIDLAPNDNTRKTAKLTNTAGEDNGYALGLKFDIQGFIDADKSFNWKTEMGVDNFFGVAYLVQVNDRITPLRRNDPQEGYVETDWFNVSDGVSNSSPEYAGVLDSKDQGFVASGNQDSLDKMALFRLAQ